MNAVWWCEEFASAKTERFREVGSNAVTLSRGFAAEPSAFVVQSGSSTIYEDGFSLTG